MVKSLSEYIREVEYIDDMNTFLESTIHECGRILYDYKNEVRQAKQKFFFEGVEEEPLLEAANDNFFAKIGRKIMELSQKVRDFFTGILDRIRGYSPDKDIAAAQKALKNQPQDVRNKVLIALEKGDISLGDVSKFEKDIEVLIDLIEKGNIDENSFKSKLKASIDKFNDSLNPIMTSVCTAAAIIAAVPKLFKACSDAKKTMQNITDWCSRVKKGIDKNKLLEPSKATAILSAISQASGFCTKEYSKRVSLLHRFSTALRKVGAGKIADKVDDVDNKNIDKHADILAARNKKANERKSKTDDYLTNKQNKIYSAVNK